MTVCFEGFEECVENENQTVIITYKFMTFYFILKNSKNDL